MKKNLPLYILLVFLLIVNGFFLFTHFSRPQKIKSKPPRDFITNELKFTADQKEKFDHLEHTHRDRMRHIANDTRRLKDALFDKITQAEVSEREIDSITSLIGNMEKQKDAEVFQHFRNILMLCDEKQKKQFSRIVKRAIHKVRGNRPPPPHRRN